MSLINKMLRDLNARHASEVESVLPDEVRPLPEPGIAARIGRGGWLGAGLIGLLAAGGAVWFVASPGMSELGQAARPASVSSSAAATASAPAAGPVGLAEDLVPSLPTLTNALPLAPPGKSAKSPGAASHATQAKSVAALPVNLRLDAMLTFAPSRAKEAPAPEKKPEPAPALKLTSVSVTPAIQKEVRGGAQKDKTEKVERTERIEKIERGERGDESVRNGVYAYKQGRVSEAVAQLQSALRENPHHASARQALLGVLVEQRRLDDAQVLLRDGLDLMPGQIGWAMALARIQVERGSVGEAWETLQKYQSAAEHSAEYQGFAGVLLQHLKKPHEATLRYKAALRLKPREGRWWYALGNALEGDNQSAEAIDAYKRAQTLGGLTPAMAEAVEKKLR